MGRSVAYVTKQVIYYYDATSYKACKVAYDGPPYHVKESGNDQEKLMILVDDANILQHEKPVEKFECFSDYDNDDTKFVDKETEPQQPYNEKYVYYFSGF